MRNLLLAATAAASLLGGTMAVGAAQAADGSPQLIFGVDRPGNAPTLDRVQYLYGGQNYCWYTGGWKGAGFYQCGYAWRAGFGWGGGYGWRGWGGGYANGWRGGPGGYGYGHPYYGGGHPYYGGARPVGQYGHPAAYQGGHGYARPAARPAGAYHHPD